jgi:hypothetical protein
MSTPLMAPEIEPLILRFPQGRPQMSDHDFYRFFQRDRRAKPHTLQGWEEA